MNKKIIFIVFCLSIITHSTIISQEIDTVKSKKIFLITKSDGGEFIGEIISDDGRELLLLTTNIGKIYINKSDISNITAVDEDINNKSSSSSFRSFLQGINYPNPIIFKNFNPLIS